MDGARITLYALLTTCRTDGGSLRSRRRLVKFDQCHLREIDHYTPSAEVANNSCAAPVGIYMYVSISKHEFYFEYCREQDGVGIGESALQADPLSAFAFSCGFRCCPKRSLVCISHHWLSVTGVCSINSTLILVGLWWEESKVRDGNILIIQNRFCVPMPLPLLTSTRWMDHSYRYSPNAIARALMNGFSL